MPVIGVVVDRRDLDDVGTDQVEPREAAQRVAHGAVLAHPDSGGRLTASSI